MKMIKKITGSLVVILLLVMNGQAQTGKEFSLKGKLQDYPGKYIYLHYFDPIDPLMGVRGQDSAEVRNGYFRFKGKIEKPLTANLFGGFRNGMKTYFLIYLAPGDLVFEGSWKDSRNYVVSGHPLTEEIYAYGKKQHAMRMTLDSLRAELEKMPDKENPVQVRYDSLQQVYEGMDEKFIATHPDSYYALVLLSLYKNGLPPDRLKTYFHSLSPELRDSEDGRKMAAFIENSGKLAVGKPAVEITATDNEGRDFQLSQLRGKYVLLDFWASWCGSCRGSNPHLLRLYHKYHPKGLEIVCISCDKNPEAWKSAIAKDGTGSFIHILSKEDINDADAGNWLGKYNVQSLPAKYLLDTEGKILGEFEDESLEQKLKEIFGF